MAHEKVYGFCSAKCKVEVVPKSGGTFTGNVNLKSDNPRMEIINTQYTRGTAPPNTCYWVSSRFYDNSPTPLPIISLEGTIDTSERRKFQIAVIDNNGTWRYPFQLVSNADYGDTHIIAPSWSVGTNDNSDKVLTIKMANKLPSLLHTYDNEVADGQKTFTTPIIDPQNQSGRVSAPNSNAHVAPYYKIASLSMDNVTAWDEATLTLDAEYGWSSNEHHVVTYRAFAKLGSNKAVEKMSLAKIWASGQAFATFLKEDHWFIAYNETQKVIEIWVKLEYDQGNLNYRVRMSGRRHENFAKWTIHSGFTGTGVASLPSSDDGWVIENAIDTSNRMTYSTPSNATGQEIATADWVIGKLAQKNKVTNVTSYDQLMDLIKNGKRGDSFGITMDYTGSSLGGITTSEAVETHAFGHYTIDEIEVVDGVLKSFQAFGSGEVSGKFVEDETKIYATTGFGRAVVFNSSGDAFRVVNEGSLTYFLTSGVTISAFDGYYISI